MLLYGMCRVSLKRPARAMSATVPSALAIQTKAAVRSESSGSGPVTTPFTVIVSPGHTGFVNLRSKEPLRHHASPKRSSRMWPT